MDTIILIDAAEVSILTACLCFTSITDGWKHITMQAALKTISEEDKYYSRVSLRLDPRLAIHTL